MNQEQLGLSEDLIRAHLQQVIDPYLGIDIISGKTVRTIEIGPNGAIKIVIKLGYPLSDSGQSVLSKAVESALNALPGVTSSQVQIHWKINPHLPQKGIKGIPGIRNILAVASGKGGVGKSTTAVNLALAIQAEGAKVGILDADIYGPSQPTMLGVKERPLLNDEKRMLPILSYGLQSMSMGYLLEDQEAPMVWRGPMVSSALQQLLQETAWDDLDYLIVDLPPGTGDIQLTLAQKIPVSGAIIVTTPQDMALLDAKKAFMMFKKLEITVLGVVENMSGHICSQCGHLDPIFGTKGGFNMAKQYEIPLLGAVPLDSRICAQSDNGKPTMVAEPDGEIANVYREMARSVTAKLSLQPRNYSAAFPTVIS